MIVFTITRPNGDIDTLKTSRTKLTVGGAYTDDITLLGRDVSPEHGVFHITGAEVVYTDNGFGTLVNDRKIVGESTPITSEDRVTIGSIVITHVLSRVDIPIPKPASVRPKPTRDAPFQQAGPFQQEGPVQPRFPGLSSFQENLSTTTEKSSLDYRVTAVIIAILMAVFWPLGFVANIIVWRQGSRDVHNKENLDPNFGCITTLLAINVLIVAMVLFIIGTLIVVGINR